LRRFFALSHIFYILRIAQHAVAAWAAAALAVQAAVAQAALAAQIAQAAQALRLKPHRNHCRTSRRPFVLFRIFYKPLLSPIKTLV